MSQATGSTDQSASRPASGPLRYAFAAVVAFGLLFGLGGATGWWTAAANEPAIGQISRWCERVSGGWLREPINTLGNLGFIASGFLMFATLARDTTQGRVRTNKFIGNQPLALAYAAATVFLGPGSMVMHGSHTFFGAWIDNVSMVVYIVIPWLFNVASLRRWADRTFLLTYASIVGLYALTYWFFGSDNGIGLDLFGLSIALWIISEVLFRFWSPVMRVGSGLLGFAVALVFGITPGQMLSDVGSYWWIVLFWVPALLGDRPPQTRRTYVPWFVIGVSSFLIAFAIWTTGTDGHAWCRPDSFIQAHAIWHLLTAVSTWSFFVFLRTDRQHAGEPANSVSVDNTLVDDGDLP